MKMENCRQPKSIDFKIGELLNGFFARAVDAGWRRTRKRTILEAIPKLSRRKIAKSSQNSKDKQRTEKTGRFDGQTGLLDKQERIALWENRPDECIGLR